MNSKAISAFVAVFAIAGMITTLPSAFADHSEVTITVPMGAGAPGCEETPEGCYIPLEAVVDVGGVVIFSNTDTAAHTFTAGTPAGGPTGEFDTSLIMAGQTYEWNPEVAGTIPYFCMVHPWMVGTIIVQEVGAEENGDHEMEEDLMVDITTGDAAAGERLSIDVEFMSMSGDVEHVNYKIKATQNGKVVLDEQVHDHDGMMTHLTAPLPNAASDSNPIDVQVEFLGYGLPGEEAKWTGPIGHVSTKKVVPEFGTIAMMILGISIVSIVVFSQKSKLIPRI